MFGDLKNYIYHYKFCTLEFDTTHINQVKANKVTSLLDSSTVEELKLKLQDFLLTKED